MAPVKSPRWLTPQGQNITVQMFHPQGSTKNFKNINAHLPKLKKLVETTCKRFKLSKATISIAIVNNAQIRKMNKQFLNKDRPTDCLSFNLSDNNSRTIEIVVNGELAVKQAKLQGHSAEAELALYITHGLLHNLGFDDATKKQAERMHNIEDQILQKLGYGPIYNKASDSIKC